jgi:protein-S-isoprenylcysteine O-methyltransferase Ste14
MKAKKYEVLEALLVTLFFLIIIVPIFMIWIPRTIILSPCQIYEFGIGKIRFLGLFPIFFGVVIYVFCSGSFVFIGKSSPILFTKTKKLIVKGFYRYVRNPLYIAGVLVLAGEAVLFQSIGIFIYCLAMFGIFYIHVLMEETFLDGKNQQVRKHWTPSNPTN